jgi:hypothetical protein
MNTYKNIVFGMYSGPALLMDVHHPAQSNGCALVVVPGSGCTSKQTYDAPPLTALGSSVRFFVPKLLDAGYTLFVVNRRDGACRRSLSGESRERPDAVRGGSRGSGGPDSLPIRVVGLVHGSVGGARRGLAGPDCREGLPRGIRSYARNLVIGARAAAAWRCRCHATVPFAMAETMREAMEKAGAEMKLIRLPGGSHDFAGEATRLARLLLGGRAMDGRALDNSNFLSSIAFR